MTSELQHEANRHDAQLTTGAKTPEGEAAARLNALRHGLHRAAQRTKQTQFPPALRRNSLNYKDKPLAIHPITQSRNHQFTAPALT